VDLEGCALGTWASRVLLRSPGFTFVNLKFSKKALNNVDDHTFYILIYS
jgi:hypothetical protein